MRIPVDAVIAREKLTLYLLALRQKNDKARYLAQVGFVQADPVVLELALRRLVEENDAMVEREDVYGVFYRVDGELRGPNGILRVTTIWIRQHLDGEVRFVTLKPYR